MKIRKKGCVYFFRHISLEPIKIGYSQNPSPYKRFNQFKTYAPFGAEIVGFIQTEIAKEIESKLHQKYSSKRLEGEWFNITDDEVDNEIKFYSSIEEVRAKNEFQIEWAKHLSKTSDGGILSEYYKSLSNKEKVIYNYEQNKDFNRSNLAKELNLSRSMIYRYLKTIK